MTHEEAKQFIKEHQSELRYEMDFIHEDDVIELLVKYFELKNKNC